MREAGLGRAPKVTATDDRDGNWWSHELDAVAEPQRPLVGGNLHRALFRAHAVAMTAGSPAGSPWTTKLDDGSGSFVWRKDRPSRAMNSAPTKRLRVVMEFVSGLTRDWECGLTYVTRCRTEWLYDSRATGNLLTVVHHEPQG